MFSKFQQHVLQHFSFLARKRLLLATSGGLDSMVMLHLCQRLDFEISIAHCNFQLRGLESFGDQSFVQEYADTHKISFFTTLFDTENFAKDSKKSIQVAARELRYDWFYELLETHHFDYILTAHHADDNLETFFINLSRGTGLDGLVGIPQQNEQIIRPLLPFSRQEIEMYAQENNILWREDSSNASDKYIRNKIRHNLVPALSELQPHFLDSFQRTQAYLHEAQGMVDDAADMVYQLVVTEIDDTIHFDIEKLKKLNNYPSYLYQWLKEYEFTAWKDIYDLVDAQSGKQVFSNHYKLLKNRSFLILSEKKEREAADYLIEKGQKEVNIPLNLSICKVSDISESNASSIFVDESALHFPLTLRKWQEGDYFYPFGMKGKKKLSKFFKDQKLSLLEKENTWLLCSKNEIVWVIGKRADDRYKVTSNKKNILKITVAR
jgi:tRNA(Ile)-lysidine synthase